MATLTAPVVTVLSKSFTGGTDQGQDAGFVAADVAGDLVPISGQGILFTVRTGGTACTATINSVTPSNYGDDKDVTMVLGTNEEQEVFIKNDGRFDQGGVNAGLVAVTYSAVTAVTVKAKTIPGM
jgi:hypothetical protein